MGGLRDYKNGRELVQRIAAGDERAFADLYHALSPAVFTYLVRVTGDQTAAEDLLQEVFLAVWEGASRFRGEASAKVWVLRIAHHKAVSWLRRQRPATDLDRAWLVASGDGVEAAALAAWEHDRLMAAIQQLPPKHREVIELVFGQQLSYAEVAAVLGCPVGTVKSRVSHALRALRYLLRDLRATELEQ